MEFKYNEYLSGMRYEEKEVGQIKAQGGKADFSVHLLLHFDF